MRSILLAALVAASTAGAALAQAPAAGDPVAGKLAFAQRCAICHKPEKGGANGVGPALYGAYGRKAGQAPGFAYSPKLLAANITWTPDKLDGWITDPQKFLPGVKMVAPPINAPADRANIIAYLKTQSDAPPASPAKGKAKPRKS